MRMLHCYCSRVLVIPDAVFGVVRVPNDPLRMSLKSKGHNNTVQNTTKPIDYNESLNYAAMFSYTHNVTGIMCVLLS